MNDKNQKLPDNIEPEEPEIYDDQQIKEKENSKKLTRLTISIQSPFPPPEILERYAQIDPEFPKKVLSMVESEQKFRHSLMTRGQKFALVIGVLGILSTTIIGIWGNPWVAGVVGFTSLATLVGAFLGIHEKENQSKPPSNA